MKCSSTPLAGFSPLRSLKRFGAGSHYDVTRYKKKSHNDNQRDLKVLPLTHQIHAWAKLIFQAKLGFAGGEKKMLY